jgi:hypothetical protein
MTSRHSVRTALRQIVITFACRSLVALIQPVKGSPSSDDLATTTSATAI